MMACAFGRVQNMRFFRLPTCLVAVAVAAAVAVAMAVARAVAAAVTASNPNCIVFFEFGCDEFLNGSHGLCS